LEVTPAGAEYLPSLNAVAAERPVNLSEVVAPWEVAEIFGQNAAGTYADPVVIHNTETDGYMVFINQATTWINDRGLTCAEFIGNWVTANIGLNEIVPLFFEDFESYAPGTDLQDVGGWAGWDGDAAYSAPVSDAFAYSGVNSVEIIGSADLVQTFAVDGGKCVFSAMQYIPSGTTGTTYFILLNQYPDNKDWSVQTTFNLDSGEVGFWHGGSATIVYDEWIELKYVIDLDNNLIDKFYNGAYIATDTWAATGHTTLQAVDLFGNGASSVYYDDIVVK
jgi:hypothetical protein